MNDFETIRANYPLTQFIRQVTDRPLKKTGSVWTMNPAPCCNHNDCFRVWESISAFKCFSCGASGTIFDYAKLVFGIRNDYQNLLKVAEIVGHQVQNSSEIEKKAPERELRQTVFNRAAEFYHQILINDKDALKIFSETRGFTIEDIEQYRLGYSGKSWNRLLNHLKKDFSEKDLLASGMIKKKDGKIRDLLIPKMFVYPHFRGRQVQDFTFKDAFKHAKRDPKTVINYRLPAEYRLCKTKFFNEDALYYDDVVFVEGPNDAIQSMKHSDKKNALALCGNLDKRADSNHESDFRMLERRCKNKTVYLCFDQDAGGSKYTGELFFALWGEAEAVNKITWDGDAKDIDDYLRRVKVGGADPTTIFNELKDKAVDGLLYLLECLPDSEDINKIMKDLDPFLERAVENNDALQFDIFVDYVKQKYKKGAMIAKHIKKQYDRRRLDEMQNADYLQNLPFYEKDGVYYHKMSRGDVNISNFRLHINDLILYDEELFYRCTINSVAGDTSENVEFSPEQRADVKKFRIKLLRHGAFYFTGKDNELSGIWQYEESKAKTRYIHYIKKYGYVPSEAMWLYENCAIKDGRLYVRDDETDFIRIDKKFYLPHDVLVYSGARPKLNIEDEYKRSFVQDVADAFHTMLDSTPRGARHTMAGYLFLGFIPATIYSNEIFARYGFFPLLFSYGPHGTGKTEATKLLLNCFGFMAQPESWSSASIAGTHQFIQQVSSLPCWYDEFLNDKTFVNMLGTIKNIYNRVGAGKGGLKEKRTIREVNGTMWLSGEDNPANAAVLSRSILFRFGEINAHKSQGYQFLMKNAFKLSVIARNLILEKSDDNAHLLLRQAETYKDFILSKSDRVDARVAANHAIIAASLQLLNIDIPAEFDTYLVKHAEKSMSYKEDENPRYLFFSEVNHLFGRKMLFESVQFSKLDNELLIHFDSVIRAIQHEVRKRGESLPIKAGSIKDYLKDMPGYVTTDRRYIKGDSNSAQKRVMVFDYGRLPEKIKESLDDVIGYEEF